MIAKRSPAHRGPDLSDGAGTSSERPQSRVDDPLVRETGSVWEDSMADNEEHDLGAHVADAVYHISADFGAVYGARMGGRHEAVLSGAPTDVQLNTQVWGTVSATGAATKSAVRIAAVELDFAAFDPGAGSQPGAGAIARALICTTEAAHGLSLGDKVTVVLDGDITTSTNFGTGGTNADLNGEKTVAFVKSELIFGWVTTGDDTADDAEDAALDANVYMNPKFDVTAPYRTIDSQTAADTKVSLSLLPLAWDGEIQLINETEGLMARTIVRDGVALQDNMQDNAATPQLKYESDAAVADTYQGIETDTAALRIANEDAATNSYSIRHNLTPFKGKEEDGHICLHVEAGRLMVKNMYGSTVVVRLERVR